MYSSTSTARSDHRSSNTRVFLMNFFAELTDVFCQKCFFSFSFLVTYASRSFRLSRMGEKQRGEKQRGRSSIKYEPRPLSPSLNYPNRA